MVVTFPRMIDVAADRLERRLVDHCAHEVSEVEGRALVDLLHAGLEGVDDLVVAAGRQEGPAGGRALLPLILEGAADQGRDHLIGVGALVHEDEVLATGLAHDPGIFMM